jgi:hypothetical protein
MENNRITLKQSDYPINEALNPIFPSLLGKGMKYLELQKSESGEVPRSERPLKVSGTNLILG